MMNTYLLISTYSMYPLCTHRLTMSGSSKPRTTQQIFLHVAREAKKVKHKPMPCDTLLHPCTFFGSPLNSSPGSQLTCTADHTHRENVTKHVDRMLQVPRMVGSGCQWALGVKWPNSEVLSVSLDIIAVHYRLEFHALDRILLVLLRYQR